MTSPTCPLCASPVPDEATPCPHCLLARASTADADATTPIPAGFVPNEPARFEPGDQVGAYEIHRLLGRGGSGEVYEATQTASGRRVALKTLYRRLRRPADRERFLAEARAAVAVPHPNRVYVLDVAEAAGIPLIAMELVQGSPLSEHVRHRGPLEPEAAVALILQVVAGLEAAHDAGLLHRDIKPSNCFLSDDGIVKVGDFGLSGGTPDDTGATSASHYIACTPAFAAPEQVSTGFTDLRTDIYGVGATLYFLLTGRPPFDADDLPTLLAEVQCTAITWPKESAVPKALRGVVERCLAKAPEARFADYADLRAALVHWEPGRTRPATLSHRLFAASLDAVVLTWLMAPVAGLAVAFHLVHGTTDLLLLSTIVFAVGGAAQQRISRTTVGMRAQHLYLHHEEESTPRWSALAIRVLVLLAPALAARVTHTLWATAPGADAASASAFTLTAVALLAPALFGQADARLLIDRLTSTRVRALTPDRQTHHVAPEPAQLPSHDARHFGPFIALQQLHDEAGESVWSAWDPQLRRIVWIHERPIGAAPLPDAVTHANRPTCLRWLQSHRGGESAWDVWVAQSGRPLTRHAGQPWPDVARWLRDIAEELHARDWKGSSASLDPRRIWITQDGRGVLLDIPRPALTSETGTQPVATPTSEPSLADTASAAPQPLLATLARAALAPRQSPLPLRASECLNTLERSGYPSIDVAARAISDLRHVPDSVPQRARGGTLLLSAATFLFVGSLVPAFVGDADRLSEPELLTQRIVAGLVFAGALMSAAFSDGGVWLSRAGMAVVDSEGRPAGALLRTWRAAIAWSWLLVPLLKPEVGHPRQAVAIVALALVHAVTDPSNGLADRLAGTRLVPR